MSQSKPSLTTVLNLIARGITVFAFTFSVLSLHSEGGAQSANHAAQNNAATIELANLVQELESE